jgi:LuxR family maltose regulon positive regulatory protein
VVIHANLMVCYWQQSDQANTFRLLKETLALGSLACFNRSVFDEAPGFGQIIGAAMQQGLLDQANAPFITMFQDVIHYQPQQPCSTKAMTTEPLTDKEREILVLLQNGLSNNAICKRTGIALSTTKWHLKNIYAKLRVKNRAEAAVKASQLIDS